MRRAVLWMPLGGPGGVIVASRRRPVTTACGARPGDPFRSEGRRPCVTGPSSLSGGPAHDARGTSSSSARSMAAGHCPGMGPTRSPRPHLPGSPRCCGRNCGRAASGSPACPRPDRHGHDRRPAGTPGLEETPPAKLAQAIVQAIEHDRPEVVVPRSDRLLLYADLLSPRLTE